MLLAIASSSPLEMIRLVVQKLDIAEYFDLLLSGDNVKQGKPFPDIYNRSAALLRVVPQNCVVIEDSNNGAKAAKSANMRCIGFQNPTSGNQDLSICDLVVNSFLDQNFDNIQNFLW
jgi:beta-phosphoglucomutase-like phosphatase (HAD superfamily)